LIADKLAKIGASHHFYSYESHSHYLTLSALEYGYTHEEIALISMLVLFQLGKGIKKSYLSQYNSLLPSSKVIKRLTNILALADALLADHPLKINFDLTVENSILIVSFDKEIAYLSHESVLAIRSNEILVEFKTN
jgi:exopolyphosphatase/guanosine-5'-triphosphate,3'-diphosphate pyrophosphatase